MNKPPSLDLYYNPYKGEGVYESGVWVRRITGFRLQGFVGFRVLGAKEPSNDRDDPLIVLT